MIRCLAGEAPRRTRPAPPASSPPTSAYLTKARRLAGLATLGTLLVLAACSPHHSAAARGGDGHESVGTIAFSVNGRAEAAGESRRIKLRFFASAPDRFRMEVRGTIGGLALIATGENGRVRIVLPTRRRYAECAVQDDLGSGLIGIPLSGCELAKVMRIASGLTSFQPCGGDAASQGEADVDADPERETFIVDSSSTGGGQVRYEFDRRGTGSFPREVRVELRGKTSSVLVLTEFKAIDYPVEAPADFYWEPSPAGAAPVTLPALAGDGAQ